MRLSVLVLFAAALAPAAGAADIGTEAAPYLAAREAGAVGSVTGRAFEESRRPDAPDLPLDGGDVVLVPRSEAFLESLHALKRRSRDSQQTYLGASMALRAAEDAYVRRLRGAGAADLVRTAAIGSDGRFTLERVPAGEWLLLVRRAVFTKKDEKPARPQTRTGRHLFVPRPALTGFYTVSTWLRALSISAGRSEHVDLTDRGVWFTGIEEQRGRATDRTSPGGGG